MTKQVIELGDEAQDAVTGFKGIVVAETRWLYGCNRFTLQPAVGKDGKVPESATLRRASRETCESEGASKR